MTTMARVHREIEESHREIQRPDVIVTPDDREYRVIRRFTGAGGETRLKLRADRGPQTLYPTAEAVRERINDGGWGVTYK